MKPVILILSILLLSGCAKEQPASHVAAQEAIKTIGALYETLPSECKTKTTDFLVTMAQNKAAKCDTECAKEKAELRRDKIKWKSVSSLLALVIIVYAVKRFLR
jgi:outer membrane murein-binding lipoprotein Lpp